jgi:N-hydroxyarylamine O-acetyltransferase
MASDAAIVDAYLRRLGLARPAGPTVDDLRRLQRAHLEAVPFENSSVLRGEPIVLEFRRLLDKVVARGRGGFCFELNGAFAWLLRSLGFEVDLMPGRFWSSHGLGPENEHLALGVSLDGERWLVDVGAGYSFLEPLRLAVGPAQQDPAGVFRIVVASDDPASLDVEWRHRDGVFRPHYRFRDRPVGLDAFQAVCEYLRTSPDSPFTAGWRCARALPGGGWATLDVQHLVVTGEGNRLEADVGAAELEEALERWFGVAPA